MKLEFEKIFEQKLQKIHMALRRKGGVKKPDKVHQRIGRAKGKYPSLQHSYNIEVSNDAKPDQAPEIIWKKDPGKHQQKEESPGVYCLCTNPNVQEEVVV